VRRADLQLEQAAATRPRDAADAKRQTRQLTTFMTLFDAALQGGLIGISRFGDEKDESASRACHGDPEVDFEHYLSTFHGTRDKRQVGQFSKGMMFTLAVYILLYGSCSLATLSLLRVREACETLWNACGRPSDTTTCLLEDAARIVLPPGYNGSSPASNFGYMDPVMLAAEAERCDLGRLDESIIMMIPLVPLVLLSVILPVGLFKNNIHRPMIKNLLIWQPQVPLIIGQSLVRAAVLTVPIATAIDTTYATIVAVEAWCLVFQASIFMLMDAMRMRTPKLRVVFALVLSIRYLTSVIGRTVLIFPAEQRRVFPEWAASTTTQSLVASMDWSVAALLLGAFSSVVFEPSKLALIRLRTDTIGFFNWRFGYFAQLKVRSLQRGACLVAQARQLKARSVEAAVASAKQIKARSVELAHCGESAVAATQQLTAMGVETARKLNTSRTELVQSPTEKSLVAAATKKSVTIAADAAPAEDAV
jgi:hypothetical protein